MSGLECLALACWGTTCLFWGCQKCCVSGRAASKEWEEVSPKEFRDVPRVCRIILAAYEKDIASPVYADRLNVDQVVRRVDYKDTDGLCPPYIIYIDHEAKDICLAIRGLNMANFQDYRTLMDHKKGAQKFDGGYVHQGLLKAASWVLDKEFELIRELAMAHPDYTVTFAGHSLGSGIVAMMAVLVKKSIGRTGFPLQRLRCYAIAPARSTSLNLAVRYSDVITSVVLQDDFLPRTSAPIEIILGASFCLPCLLCCTCCRDLFVSDAAKLRDPRRLYVPGRLYHILYTKDCSCQNAEPFVLTAVPVEHRFEHIVFSRTTINDHSIVHIESVAERAVAVMAAKHPPEEQTMGSDAALERKRTEQVVGSLLHCKSLSVPNCKAPDELAAELATPATSASAREDRTGTGPPTTADGLLQNGHTGSEEKGLEAVSSNSASGRRRSGRSSELEELDVDPLSMPVANRWKEAVRKVQKKPSQQWERLLTQLLQEEGELSPKRGSRPEHKTNSGMLPSLPFTGIP